METRWGRRGKSRCRVGKTNRKNRSRKIEKRGGGGVKRGREEGNKGDVGKPEKRTQKEE